MPTSKTFRIALILSLIAHGFIFFGSPGLNLFNRKSDKENLEISYIKEEIQTKSVAKPDFSKKEPLLKFTPKITSEKKSPPPFMDRDSILKGTKELSREQLSFTKPKFISPDVIAIKKKITVPDVDINKIDNPSYISYYQVVREKIKRAAYQNYTGREQGEVAVSFIISNQGELKKLRLMDEKSIRSEYLREIALKSVIDASDFPVFPVDLDYPQLSFNLAITFEVE